MENFGKTNLFNVTDFKDFETAYAEEYPFGKSPRTEQREEGCFRYFTREQIAERNDNLDQAWLKDIIDEVEDELNKPEEIAATILEHLRATLAIIEMYSEDL